ncbi:MAG: AAA family ATPase [Alteromonadaceae bacterium]|nr:MAG: AAA family ATPase [Alteromonadaceae bacterium]
MSNDIVIAALEAGLAASPDNTSLKMHLAKFLAEGEDKSERAFELAQSVIMVEPTNQDALILACKLAERLGQSEIALSYQSLLDSLPAESQGAGLSEGQDLKGQGSKEQEKLSELTASSGGEAKSQAQQGDKSAPERVRGAKLRLVTEEKIADGFVDVEDSNIYLDDVGGMEEVKKRLKLSFLAPLQNPELMKAYGKSVGGGLLLFGPPGCGKTFVARALAGELGAKFISIGLTDILDMYIGESERKLHELFENARRHAPAVLFIDELDALGQKRSQLRSSGMRTLVNQLLTELDSIGQDNENLFVLAATNHPWDVDSALRRPGRFDRVVAVYPPDVEARGAILSHHLKNKPIDKIDIDGIARKTNMFSGADLAHLCNAAVEYVLEEAIESGQVRGLRTDDFVTPLKETKPSTLPWFDTARNYAMFANENGIYDDLLEFINKNKL